MSEASPALTAAVVRDERRMFLQASTSSIITTTAALAGLVFATLDYEENYSSERTHDNCKENGPSESLRWLDLTVTLVAAIFSCLGHIKINELDQQGVLPQEKYKKMLYFFIPRGKVGFSLLIDLAILSVFPYPGVSGNLRLSEHEHSQSLYTWTDVCYTSSEILYVCMFSRLFFLVRNMLHLIGYLDSHSRGICREQGVKANLSFTLRSLVRLHPVFMVLIFILPTALVLGVFLRVFERPYMDVSGLDYEPYYNSLWLALMTISTVNYADFYPTTHLGRVVALFCGVWGFCLVSMMVFLIDKNFALTKKEEKALFRIKKTRLAAKVLVAALSFHHAKINKFPYTEQYRSKLLKSIAAFKRGKHALNQLQDDLHDEDIVLRKKVEEISKLLKRLEDRMYEKDGRISPLVIIE